MLLPFDSRDDLGSAHTRTHSRNACVHIEVIHPLFCILTSPPAHLLRILPNSCQTYEGGFSASSFPYFSSSTPDLPSLLPSPRPSLGEAHGGYTFCAVASLVLLRIDAEKNQNPQTPTLDTKRLLRWAVGMQGLDIEGGGFKGRTNKLVDGCYSWWVGGVFALIEDLLGIGGASEEKEFVPPVRESEDDVHEWLDFEGVFHISL